STKPISAPLCQAMTWLLAEKATSLPGRSAIGMRLASFRSGSFLAGGMTNVRDLPVATFQIWLRGEYDGPIETRNRLSGDNTSFSNAPVDFHCLGSRSAATSHRDMVTPCAAANCLPSLDKAWSAGAVCTRASLR